MKYLLDTNVCIAILRRRPTRIMEHWAGTTQGLCGMSVVTYCELLFGAAKSDYPSRETGVVATLRRLVPEIAFESRAASYYANLRAGLERSGELIGPLDMLIAAHALSLSVTLVTANTREFNRIPGLKIADWSR